MVSQTLRFSPNQLVSGNDEQYACCVCFYLNFFLNVSQCLNLRCLVGKNTHACVLFALQKNYSVDLVFFQRFLVASDNRLEVQITSYCLRLPVFRFGRWHEFNLQAKVFSLFLLRINLKIIACPMKWVCNVTYILLKYSISGNQVIVQKIYEIV